MLPRKFASFDVVDLGLLTPEELDQMAAVAASKARAAQLRGDVSTSLESRDSVIDYRLVDGDMVTTALPKLDSLYRNEFLEQVRRAFAGDYVISPDRVNGVNINVVEGTGGRYEWHVDSNPLTGLLVMTPSDALTGGRLIFGKDSDSQTALSLFAGQLLFFDARQTPHAVESLRGDWTRITAPMNYFVKSEKIVRPRGLDEALYNSSRNAE